MITSIDDLEAVDASSLGAANASSFSAVSVADLLLLDLPRHHLPAGVKRQVIAALLRARADRSDRAIGEIALADHKTVAAVRTDLERHGEIPHVTTRTDTLGRQQPARKPMVTPRNRGRGVSELPSATVASASIRR